MTPMALLALVSGLVSTLVMGSVLRIGSKSLSLVGVSALGAFFHSLTLFVCASIILLKSPLLLRLMPFFLLMAVISGSINGMIAQFCYNNIKSLPLTWSSKKNTVDEEHGEEN